MRTPSFISAINSWSARHIKVILVIAMLPAIAGLLADRFVGGRVAEVAGRIQAGFLFAYLFVAATRILFGPYGLRTTRVLEYWPVALVRFFVFMIIPAVAFYIVGATLLSFAPGFF